jgi:hypothetical protein
LENGSVVEIPGTAPQPGWLLFRCAVSEGNRTDPSLTPPATSSGTGKTSAARQAPSGPERATAGARAKMAAGKASSHAGAAAMVPPEPDDNEGPHALVYGNGRNGLLFIQKSIARELLAVKAARNWGDLRKGSPELYEQALELTVEDREENTTPADNERFEIESIGAFHDGDFPYFPQQLMERFIPDSVQERFANSVGTVHNGDMLVFDDGCEAEVVAALRDLGFTCDKQQALINKIE